MRLCLVSSILALIVIILAESRSNLMLVFLALSLVISLLIWHKTSPFTLLDYSNRKIQSRIVLILLTVPLTAIYCHSWLNDRLNSRLPASYSGAQISGIADVIQCDYSSIDVEKYVLDLVSVDQPDPFLRHLRKIAVSNYINGFKAHETKENTQAEDKQPQGMRCGFRVKFDIKLRAPYSFINPVGFDYEAWLLSKGIDASGYFINFDIISNEPNLKQRLINWRQKGVERAADLPGLSGQVVPALLFGVSGYLEKKRWTDLQMTGAIHLLVVSGLHVGFLVLMVVLIWRVFIQLEVLLFQSSYSYLLRLTPLILMVCCLMYAYMAGLGLAVQRSSLMLLITIVVSYYKSYWSLLDTWLWVAWLVLVINPLASLSIGFWFSFAAVGSLLLTHVGAIKVDKKYSMKDLTFWRNGLAVLLKPQWIIFITLMPFLWMFQQSQSVWSLLVNTLAIPMLAIFILPLSLLALAFPTSFIPTALNSLLSLGFDNLQAIASDSSWLVFKPAGLWLLVLMVIVLTLLMFKSFPFRRLSLLILGLVYLLPLKAIEEKVLVFDVGQGLSVAGIFQQEAASDLPNSWVYDTGAKFRSGFSLGQAVVAKNLLSQSVNSLDLLFISHSDNDHAGGEEGLKRVINVDTTYAGQPSTKDHIDCHSLTAKWREGSGFNWRVLNLPSDDILVKDNNLSCVVQFEIKGRRILLPGDIEAKMEERLVQFYGAELESEVLIVPHHGSKTSSSIQFLDWVAPKIAIISSGYKNSFRHPHIDVLKRYREYGIEVYNTAHSGAVELDFSGDVNQGLKIFEWRKQNPPIWRQM